MIDIKADYTIEDPDDILFSNDLNLDGKRVYTALVKGEVLTGCVHAVEGKYVFWLENGIIHKTDKPAFISYSSCDGKKYWALDGKFFATKELWFEKLTLAQKQEVLWNLDE